MIHKLFHKIDNNRLQLSSFDSIDTTRKVMKLLPLLQGLAGSVFFGEFSSFRSRQLLAKIEGLVLLAGIELSQVLSLRLTNHSHNTSNRFSDHFSNEI